MKKFIIAFSTVLFVAFAAFAQDNPNAPEFKFEKEVHDFGTVIEGTQAVYEFKFTNTGKEPLVLTAVNASCGCTTPEWPKEPIMPGQSSTIKAIYNSANRPGPFNKSITITSNAKTPRKVIYIKGNVEKGAEENLTPANGSKSGPVEK